MNRRKFLKNGSLVGLGTAFFNPLDTELLATNTSNFNANKKAKNIIFMVSDGMSIGTLNMADLYLRRKEGRASHWLKLYEDQFITRGLMDTSSANSIVTDSAAASSAWGGGVKVNNGALNVSVNGEKHLPIWQKFKKSGKLAGCVSTVPVTHATPAGFCVNSDSRDAQEEIALQYLELGFDILMGGGNNYFSSELRKDKKDVYAAYRQKGWQVVKDRKAMLAADPKKNILGIFGDNGLPFALDRQNDKVLSETTPTLAEMTLKAIERMKDHKGGFVLQVEAGKVDWGAHANDIGALLYDQIAFDDAIKVAIDFASQDGETLVVITTDHGNANPGLIYGKDTNANFDSLWQYTHTNEWILNTINASHTEAQVREIIENANKKTVSSDQAKQLLGYYTLINKGESGLYNYKNVPFKALAQMQQKTNSVGWISMDHSADYTEVALFGPGSTLLKPFIKNTDLHCLMLEAAEVENKF